MSNDRRSAAPAAAAARAQAVATPPRSPLYDAYLKRLRRRRVMVVATQFGVLLAFFGLWELAPRMHWVNPMLTSYPSQLATTFMQMLVTPTVAGNLLDHTRITVIETVIGFSASMLIGLLVAIGLWWSDFAYRVADPFLVVLNALPKIALVPIFYIWLGPQMSIYAMAIAIAVFVTILMLYSGFTEIDPDKIKLVRSFGASKAQVLRKVVLPGSVPTMIAALKINVGLALVGVIVGEFQSAKAGLGYLIMYGSQIFQMGIVMSGILVLALISTVMYLAIAWLETVVLRHRR